MARRSVWGVTIAMMGALCGTVPPVRAQTAAPETRAMTHGVELNPRPTETAVIEANVRLQRGARLPNIARLNQFALDCQRDSLATFLQSEGEERIILKANPQAVMVRFQITSIFIVNPWDARDYSRHRPPRGSWTAQDYILSITPQGDPSGLRLGADTITMQGEVNMSLWATNLVVHIWHPGIGPESMYGVCVRPAQLSEHPYSWDEAERRRHPDRQE